MLDSDRCICLLAATLLERQAYRRLIEAELGRAIDTDSDFSAVSIWQALRQHPSLVVCVSDAPASDVRDVLGMVQRLEPKAQILVVSGAMGPGQLDAWADCPLHGFVVKSGGIAELGAAMRTVLRGGEFFSAGVKQALAGVNRSNGRLHQLTRREAELLPLLARGLSLREAAASMTVSYKTADSYRTSLLRKLGVRDRVELARFAIREKIVDV